MRHCNIVVDKSDQCNSNEAITLTDEGRKNRQGVAKIEEEKVREKKM